MVSRFREADSATWARPAGEEVREHFTERFLSAVPPGTIIDMFAKAAASFREDLVVFDETGDGGVRAQAGGLRVEASADADPPHRLASLLVYRLSQLPLFQSFDSMVNSTVPNYLPSNRIFPVTEQQDRIDAMLDQWRLERPDLEVSATGVLGRFARVYELGVRAVEEVFARHGLQRGEFDVLAALRRTGAPYTLTPSVLAEHLMLSRAGMTSRLDRLEAAGLVKRSLDAGDRRSFKVRLTPRGLDVIEAAVTEHFENQSRLLALLDPGERDTLDHLLRKLLRELDADAGRKASR
ncbi:MAG: MarR family winged helix-turn-helix transcriptional regulator [Trebonia sp.]